MRFLILHRYVAVTSKKGGSWTSLKSVAQAKYCTGHDDWTSDTGEIDFREENVQSDVPNAIESDCVETLDDKKDQKIKKKATETKQVRTADIKAFFDQHNFGFIEQYTGFRSTCPRFRFRYEEEGADKLYVNKKTGYFKCDFCGKSGEWQSLLRNVESLLTAGANKEAVPPNCFKNIKLATDREKIMLRADELDTFEMSKPLREVRDDILHDVLEKLELQLLERRSLEKFDAHVHEEKLALILPWYTPSGQLAAYRMISLETTADGKKKIEKGLFGKSETLFGMQNAKESWEEFVLVEDEVDAMTVYQTTGKFAIAASSRSKGALPQQVLPELEKFRKIIVWVDDRSGRAASYSRILDETRCYGIRESKRLPGPYKTLQKGVSLQEVLSRAQPVSNAFITTFEKLRDEVKNELLNKDSINGIPWKRFPKLNEILKGHRRGELTVFTGPTGAGKTTFMSEYTLDLCESGVNTLWGSFEISNKRLMGIMLRQFAGFSFGEDPLLFDVIADRFDKLPMYFMTFHGEESIDRVIETMAHAVNFKDISHVIVDNLQFMMGVDTTPGNDRYLKQDAIIAAFRKFATVMDCHVTLVIHPRKESGDVLTLQSLFGSAKSGQEADNVIILQKRQYERATSGQGKKYIEIVKNRFEGDLGIMTLNFRKDALSFAPKKTENIKNAEDLDGYIDENNDDSLVKKSLQDFKNKDK